MSALRWNRDDFGWHYGLVGRQWWLSICHSSRRMTCLDIGVFRIRWAGPEFRPLFSERYGYQRWYGVGRLKVNRSRRAKPSVRSQAHALLFLAGLVFVGFLVAWRGGAS